MAVSLMGRLLARAAPRAHGPPICSSMADPGGAAHDGRVELEEITEEELAELLDARREADLERAGDEYDWQ